MNINNIYFYLLLGVFLYFLFTYVLENYLVEQENFDPSLVPVSSIVTLAKVAQKLVNGNGTLTNPGNLQIGKDMQATGALTVTGKTAIGSTTMGADTLNVTGTLGVSGDTNVGGNTTIDGKLILTNTKEGSGYITSGVGKTGTQGRLHISNGEDLFLLPKGTTHVSNAWGGTGNLNVSGTTTMNGTSSLKTNVWHTSTDGANRLHYTDKAGTYFGSGDGTYYWRSNTTGKMDASGQNGGIMELNSDGNLNVKGNLNARTVEGYNTRVGGIWTSGGIYAEGTSNNLEIGASSSNVYIGAANGGAKNNLIVTGNVNPHMYEFVSGHWDYGDSNHHRHLLEMGLRTKFQECSNNKSPSCDWFGTDMNGSSLPDPKSGTSKTMDIYYKCGLNGNLKRSNTPGYSWTKLTFNCP